MNETGLLRRKRREFPGKYLAAVGSLVTGYSLALPRVGEHAPWQTQTNSCALRSGRSISGFERKRTRTVSRQSDRILWRYDVEIRRWSRGLGRGSDAQGRPAGAGVHRNVAKHDIITVLAVLAICSIDDQCLALD